MSVPSHCGHALRASILPILALMFAFVAPASASAAEVCGDAEKQAAAEALAAFADLPEAERLAAEAELYKKFSVCLPDAAALVAPAAGPPLCGVASQVGSLFYEEMGCCGYDPQRRQFACPVTIKRRLGFGPAPLPGSREYVLHCVADAAGVLQPVGVDSVHLADEQLGQSPRWQLAVIAAANQNLPLVQPMNGATRRARSILSWGFQPVGCGFQPIWGHALNYRIRLDQ